MLYHSEFYCTLVVFILYPSIDNKSILDFPEADHSAFSILILHCLVARGTLSSFPVATTALYAVSGDMPCNNSAKKIILHALQSDRTSQRHCVSTLSIPGAIHARLVVSIDIPETKFDRNNQRHGQQSTVQSASTIIHPDTMASLPSLLARGYIRSRRIPRVQAISPRFQHAPPSVPQQPPLDVAPAGRVDLFPSTRVSTGSNTHIAGCIPVSDGIGRAHSGSSETTALVDLVNALKVRILLCFVSSLHADPFSASRHSLSTHQSTLARVSAHPLSNFNANRLAEKRSQGRQRCVPEGKNRSRQVSLLDFARRAMY